MDWQRHVETSQNMQAAAEQQQAEQWRLGQERHNETYRILGIMDLVVVDFLSAAWHQNFPGARPHFVQVPGGIFREQRQVQQGVEYVWGTGAPSKDGEPIFAHVHSSGDWAYVQSVEDRSDEYVVSLSCGKTAGRLGARQYNFNGWEKNFVLDESIPNKLMSVLADIAVKNNIQL